MGNSVSEERVKVSLGRSELLAFAESNISFYGIDLSRISSIFLAQLLQLYSSRVIDISNVTAEIKAMEGIGPKQRTGNESMFNLGTILEGFHKKHFTDALFIVKNLTSELGLESGCHKNLTRLIGKTFHEHKGQNAGAGFDKAIGHESTIGTINRRAGRNALTGEWIVFKKHKGKRFYLCLAAHSEPNEQILARTQDAIAMDFQFLAVDV